MDYEGVRKILFVKAYTKVTSSSRAFSSVSIPLKSLTMIVKWGLKTQGKRVLLFLLVDLIHSFHPLLAVNPRLVQTDLELVMIPRVSRREPYWSILPLLACLKMGIAGTQSNSKEKVKVLRIVDVLCSRKCKNFINTNLFNLYNTLIPTLQMRKLAKVS